MNYQGYEHDLITIVNYQGYEHDLITIARYVGRLKEEVDSTQPLNIGLISSLARTTAHLAEAMLANQILNPRTTGD